MYHHTSTTHQYSFSLQMSPALLIGIFSGGHGPKESSVFFQPGSAIFLMAAAS